jgi:hypothetical protein
MSEKDYHGKYCPLRQSNVQALKCIEEYCMFYRKGDLRRSDSCWIKDALIGIARTWEIKE